MSEPTTDHLAAANRCLYNSAPNTAAAHALVGILEQLTRVADMFQAVRDEAAADEAFARENGQSWRDAASGNFQCPPVRATD